MRTTNAAVHVWLWALATCVRQAAAFIHGSHVRYFDDGPTLRVRGPSFALQHIGAIAPYTATCPGGRRGSRRPQQQQQHQPPKTSRSSYARLRAMPEDTDVEGSTSRSPSATSSSSEASEMEGMPSGDAGRKSRGAGSTTSTGKDGQFISKLARRLADSFPLLTADEIKNEVRMLLNPETKGEANKAAGGREDNLALLAKDVRELVEDLMEQVGSSTDAKAGLAELKDVAQKFKGVLKGDPAAAEQLRRRVLDDLEDVREEIEALLEVEELSKARDRLEKATAESTEMVFDSAVTALAKGLDKVVNEGKDTIPEGEDTEKFTVSTYFYGKDNEFWDDMRANGVTRQRFFLYTLLGAAVALGGNLFGVTSGLLGALAPQASRDLRVDLLFPIGGFKRFYSPEDGYEFMYPQGWVGDSGLALRRQRDLEDMRASPAAVARARQRRSSSAPDVAFGPQGGDGIENVSLVKSQLMAGFSLKKTLGEPQEAAEKILSTVIAPPGSGREWELLDAFEDRREPGGLVYQFEYRVQGERIRKPMRNIGVVAARGSTLFTVTVLAPEESWRGGRGDKFRQTAKSFRLTY